MAISCGFKEVMAFIASVSMRPTLMKQQQYKTCTRRLIQRNKTYIKLLLLEIGREQTSHRFDSCRVLLSQVFGYNGDW